MKERNLYFSNDDKTAWFDEILTNKGYGEFRGTGVLKMVGSQWKIVQYNLLLPIPNNLMKKYEYLGQRKKLSILNWLYIIMG